MTDHLTRLAARALGLADTLRPRRTLFEPQHVVPEPVSTSEPKVEQAAIAPTAPSEDAREAETVVVRTERREKRIPPAAVAPIAEEKLEHAAAPPVETPAPAPRERTPTRSEPPEKPGPALTREEPVSPERPPRDLRVERVTQVATHRVPLLSTRPPYRPPPREPQPEQAPTVRVRIGRVDVRADAPEQPVERRRPKEPPRMSLDEYLSRSRDGGR